MSLCVLHSIITCFLFFRIFDSLKQPPDDSEELKAAAKALAAKPYPEFFTPDVAAALPLHPGMSVLYHLEH